MPLIIAQLFLNVGARAAAWSKALDDSTTPISSEALSVVYIWRLTAGVMPNFLIMLDFPVQETTSGIGHRVK